MSTRVEMAERALLSVIHPRHLPVPVGKVTLELTVEVILLMKNTLDIGIGLSKRNFCRPSS